MDNVIAIITEYWPVVTGVIGGALAVYIKYVAPKTKSKWDDENLPKAKDFVDKVTPSEEPTEPPAA